MGDGKINIRNATLGAVTAALVFTAGAASASTLADWQFEGTPGTEAVGASSIID